MEQTQKEDMTYIGLDEGNKKGISFKATGSGFDSN